MHPKALGAVTIIGCLVALTACSLFREPAASEAGAKPAQPAEPESAAPTATITRAAEHGDAATTAPADVVERGRKALAEAGLSPDLKLVSSEKVEWPDSSLGCRQPGVMYLQVITPGYLLRYAGAGTTHEVHVADNAAIVCSPQLGTGVPKRPATAYRARDLDTVVDQARRDLATRVSTPVDEVKFLNFSAATWPDSRLGCGQPVPDAPAGEVRGYKLLFATGGQYYTYHTDLKRTFPCPPIEVQ
jgi:hypothetical protein